MKIRKIELEDDYLVVWADEFKETGVHIKLKDFNNENQFKAKVKAAFDKIKLKEDEKKLKKDKEKDYVKYTGDTI